MENIQYAGFLGRRGYSFNPHYNKKVDVANKIINEYNNSITKFVTEKEQMDYQEKILKEVENVLAVTAKDNVA